MFYLIRCGKNEVPPEKVRNASSPVGLLSMILAESFCRVDQQLQVFRNQVFRQITQLAYKLSGANLLQKELL